MGPQRETIAREDTELIKSSACLEFDNKNTFAKRCLLCEHQTSELLSHREELWEKISAPGWFWLEGVCMICRVAVFRCFEGAVWPQLRFDCMAEGHTR